jgi:hypothetical protein
LGRVAELISARRCASPRPSAEARKRCLMIWAPRLLICQMHEPLIINNSRAKTYGEGTQWDPAPADPVTFGPSKALAS